MRRVLLLGALALAADPVPPSAAPSRPPPALTSSPDPPLVRLSATSQGQPDPPAGCDKSELLLKIWKALKPAEGPEHSAERSRLDGFQLEQARGADGGLQLRVVFRLQIPARAPPACRAALDRLIDMADAAYRQLIHSDMCAASVSQLDPISPLSPFDSLSPLQPLGPHSPVSPLAPLSPPADLFPAVPVLPSSNPLDDILATFHDGSDNADLSPSSLQSILKKLAEATLDADKKPAFPAHGLLNDDGSSLSGKLQEILSLGNTDGPSIGQRPAVIELTYVLRRPKPLVYQPYYYVKYHIPFRTFVHNFRKLLAEQPYASRSPEQFYRELVSLSTVAEVSPDLRVYDQRDIGRLVFGNGTLVDARLLALSRSLPPSAPSPSSVAARSLNVSSDTLEGAAPQEIVDVLMKKLNVSLQPPPPLRRGLFSPLIRPNSLMPAVLSSLSSVSPLVSSQSSMSGLLSPSSLNTQPLLSNPSQLYSVPPQPQYSSFPSLSKLQFSYPPAYSSYPSSQSSVYPPSYSSYPDPQSPVYPSSYSSFASSQSVAPLSDTSLLQSLPPSLLLQGKPQTIFRK